MNRLLRFVFLLLLTLMLSASGFAQSQSSSASSVPETLTNDSIIKLSKARFKERTIIHLIRNSVTAFDLSTPKLVELKRNGVNERIITEMIDRQRLTAGLQNLASLRDDEFFKADDEAFFNSVTPRAGNANDKRTSKNDRNDRNDRASSEEASIFGSSSGSQNRTRTRGLGASGDQSRQSDVSGAVTARIIRPPSESSEPKLERAPRLDNKDIIEMIQAGFSEGTVLRKIGLTQVEFDLSPKAVAELRNNRVSERIIKAMTEAMGEGEKQ